MARDEKIDLCIIGAGPAGISAAERARALGRRVVLVEAGEMGGVSHNWGTLPAQALAEAAERAHQIRTAREFGLSADEPRINFSRVNSRVRAAIEAAAPAVSPQHFAALGVETVAARARFIGPATIEAGERTIRAANFLIATGSRPIVPDVPGLDSVPYFTPETIFEVTRRPSHLLVIGGGATGLALAQSHLRLGCQVSLVEMLDPLADEDPELVQAVVRRLRAEGLELHTHTGVVSVSGSGEQITLETKTGPDEAALSGSHLLIAAGRRADSSGLGLDAAKVRMEGAIPQLRRFGRTSNPRIFIAGDAAGLFGVHAARQSAHAAVDAMFGRGWGRPALLPHIVHTRPALAWVGMTEQQARARHGTRFTIVRTGFSQTEAAHARAEPNGHLKLLVGPAGTIVGAGVVGPHAAELIAILALAITQRLTPYDLQRLTVPHPSFAQVIALAADDYVRAHPEAGRAGWRVALKRLLP